MNDLDLYLVFVSRSRQPLRNFGVEYLGNRFEQIQDGGYRHVEEISSGDISATGRPIHFMFCSTRGFRGRRI